MKYLEISLIDLAKPVGVGAASQLWLGKAEQSGLLTLTATTEGVLVALSDEKVTAFAELAAKLS